MEIERQVISTFHLTHGVYVDNKKTFPFYGSVEDADNYFYMHNKYGVWAAAEREDKLRALVVATRIIDRFNFISEKADEDQTLQFPRLDSTAVPISIEKATYEIAVKIAEGFDPDVEADNLSVKTQGFAGARTEYDRSYIPDYLRAGVPSQSAWALLFPFLRNPNTLRLLRSS